MLDCEKPPPASRLPLYPGKVQRWLVETRAGENPTEQSSKDAIVEFFNLTLPAFGLARAFSAATSTPRNVERLNVLNRSRTQFRPVGANELDASEGFELGVDDEPSVFVQVEFLYTGDAESIAWPWGSAGFLRCPEDASTIVREVYSPIGAGAARRPETEPPLPGTLPFPERPELPDIDLPSGAAIAKGAFKVAVAAGVLGLAYVWLTTRSTRDA